MKRRLLSDMRVLVERAPALGLDQLTLQRLRGTEEWDELEVPERIRRGNAMWAFALATAPDPVALPVRLAEVYEPDDVGVLGLAMRTADTFGDALDRCARYHELFLPLPVWRFEPDRDGLSIPCVWNPPLEPLHVQVSVEFLVALLPLLGRKLTGRTIPVLEASFRHEARGSTHALSEALGVTPRFGSETSGLRIPSEALAYPLLRADKAVSTFVVSELDAIRAREVSGDADLLHERLKTTIRARLPDGPPTMTDAARRLGVSERTLRRRLAERGTTYDALVDSTREGLARALVRGTAHPLAEVSYLLGFSEPSAFHRAFKRWTGETPARFREG